MTFILGRGCCFERIDGRWRYLCHRCGRCGVRKNERSALTVLKTHVCNPRRRYK